MKKLKTIITLKEFKHLLKHQETLDETIRARKNITVKDWMEELSLNHGIALHVEISEFINECHDSWKYWKDKAPDKERIIDEAIDVIHFACLIMNKYVAEESVEVVYKGIIRNIKDFIEEAADTSTIVLLNSLRTLENIEHIFSLVLIILERYNFNGEDIMKQYADKNAINFERLNNGY